MQQHSKPSILNTVSHMGAVEFLCGLPTDGVDMALTSPPYNNLRTYGGHNEFDFETIAQETYRVLKPGGVLVWVVGDATIDGSETLTSMRQALYFVDTAGFRMHDTMVYQNMPRYPDNIRYSQSWEYMFILSKGKPTSIHLQTKPNIKAGITTFGKNRTKDGKLTRGDFTVKTNGTMPNVWKINAGYMQTTKDKEAYQHPAMFPEKLAERHILTWSNPGDIIMDYFMGSGTTAKMARNNGRHYIGCDINAEYVQVARERLALPYTLPMFEEVATEEKPGQAVMELG